MDERIAGLQGAVAVELLRDMARQWIKERGLEAFLVIDGVRREDDEYDRVSKSLAVPAGEAPEDLVKASREALDAILSGEDSEAAVWVEEVLEQAAQAKAHVVEPITAAIFGATIIGIILASRVKRIGNVTFFKGLPKGVGSIVEKAARIFVPGPG